jgi:hypothetical protein
MISIRDQIAGLKARAALSPRAEGALPSAGVIGSISHADQSVCRLWFRPRVGCLGAGPGLGVRGAGAGSEDPQDGVDGLPHSRRGRRGRQGLR